MARLKKLEETITKSQTELKIIEEDDDWIKSFSRKTEIQTKMDNAKTELEWLKAIKLIEYQLYLF